MTTLAIVPARAGSKGLPGKNKRDFCGKPLVSWAIECGQRTCDRVCVTSDDPDILAIAGEAGVQVVARPVDLADDTTPMIEVLKHALAFQLQPVDTVVLLQPTQPLRTDDHVREALWVLRLEGCDSVVSVVDIPQHMSPDYACKIESGLLRRFLTGEGPSRRQDCRPAYYRDGTVYAIKARLIREGKMYGSCKPLFIKQQDSCSIDTESDWTRAERMWRERHGSV